MKRFIFIILIVGGLAALYTRQYHPETWNGLVEGFKESALGQKFYSQSYLPPPLRSLTDSEQAFLTKEGVLAYTNRQRAANNLPELRLNSKLAAAANLKISDMFDTQYFEHVSPTGQDPSDLARQVSYKFLIVGENLALGNFLDDEALVEAWINSPGHRANILNDRYQEIGIAVAQGEFEGKRVWLAVQSFGTPLSSCPQPSGTLRGEITQNENRLEVLQTQLETLKNEMETTRYQDQATYNRKVEEYNQLVARVNNLAEELKVIVAQYNSQVESFNRCLEGL